MLTYLKEMLELLDEELVTPNLSKKQFNGKWLKPHEKTRRNDNSGRKSLGVGTQASVKADPTDPHMVRKHNTRPYGWGERENDGFNEFIEFLIANKAMDNIHFPKVYDIKTIVDSKGRHIHTYRMERLISHRELNKEEIQAVLEQHFASIDTSWMVQNGYKDERYVEFAMEAIVTVMADAIHGDSSRVTSETLKEALNVCRQAANALGANVDISSHTNNVLFRRQSTGVVPVISDPFY